MPLSLELLRQHWAYNTWATNRLLAAVRHLSPDELNHDFKTADRSVVDTMAHLFWSERIWLDRLQLRPPLPRPALGSTKLALLDAEWPDLQLEWRNYLAGAEDTSELIRYKDLKGQEWTQPLWQLVFHVVNHGTHHRGQVSGFLRALNQTPPPLDFIAYHRQLS